MSKIDVYNQEAKVVKSIELSDASTGSFAFFLKPAIAPVIAVIVLREVILWNTVVGIALILMASLLKLIYDRQQHMLEILKKRRMG